MTDSEYSLKLSLLKIILITVKFVTISVYGEVHLYSYDGHKLLIYMEIG